MRVIGGFPWRGIACEADFSGVETQRELRRAPDENHLFCFRLRLVSKVLLPIPGKLFMHRNKLYFIGLFFLIFLGVGVYLNSKEVIFAFTQAPATPRVVDKTVSHSCNPGNRSGRDEHFLVCEIRPDPRTKLIGGTFKLITSAGV